MFSLTKSIGDRSANIHGFILLVQITFSQTKQANCYMINGEYALFAFAIIYENVVYKLVIDKLITHK